MTIGACYGALYKIHALQCSVLFWIAEVSVMAGAVGVVSVVGGCVVVDV
jgi:hypothetical protein